MPRTRRRVVAGVLAIACGMAYAALSLIRFHRFALSSWDNAIFEQAVRGYAHWGAPTVDVKGPGFNQLGDHFSPILVLVAPFYRVFPSAQTILIAQAVLIAVSVAVVSALAMRRLGTIVGLAIGLAYGLSFGIQSAVEVDFHEVAFAAPLLAFAGAAYVDRRFGALVLWSLPLLLVKEDFGVTVAAIGAVLWLAGERRRGLVLGAIGLAATTLTVLVIIPRFAPDGAYTYTDMLGGDRGIMASLVSGSGRKFATVVLTLGITGLAALASPWLLVGLPTFAWRFVGDNPYYWGTDFHYSLALMPIVFIAMIDAMTRLRQLRWATTLALAVTGFTLINSPLSVLVHSGTYTDPPRASSARAVLALVPHGASVETDIGLMTHLTTNHTVYWIGTVGTAKPSYVLIDTGSGIGSPEDVIAYAEQKHGGRYALIYHHDGYVLARRQVR